MNLSHDGEIHPSPKLRYKELIVFVHHFGGSKIALRRHIELVNGLGFDALSFNLTTSDINLKKLPFLGNEQFGNRKVWCEDIESVLKEIDRPLIFFSFSFPSCSVAKYIKENHTMSCKAWICDGGPFVNMRDNYWNYFTHVTPIKNKWVRHIASEMGAIFLGLDNYEEKLLDDIKTMDSQIPILSIRSMQDSLVPPLTIERCFQKRQKDLLQVLEIPEGNHLEGLKKCPQLYKEHVEAFLTPLTTKQKNF